MNVLVLGAGLVGAPMVRDLAQDEKFQVTVADISEASLDALSTQARVTAIRLPIWHADNR